MIPDRAGNAENWELDRLIIILLGQFQRLFDHAGVSVTHAQIEQIGQQAAQRALPPEAARSLIEALAELVAESEAVLAGLDLTFHQALHTDMSDMSGWESTADFLQLANEKVNAEVRISAGAALMLLLGDARYTTHLLDTIEHDLQTQGRLDVDAVIARRALLFAAGIARDDPDWLSGVRSWADQH